MLPASPLEGGAFGRVFEFTRDGLTQEWVVVAVPDLRPSRSRWPAKKTYGGKNLFKKNLKEIGQRSHNDVVFCGRAQGRREEGCKDI